MSVAEVSETIAAKASRLLCTGRVHIDECKDGRGHATVVGDTGVYRVEFGPAGVVCSCPAWKTCSHATAVALVVERAS